MRQKLNNYAPFEVFHTIEQQFCTLDCAIGQWNCKHIALPILLGISQPAYTDEELAAFARNGREEITIDGITMTRYEWTQKQRQIETAVRAQKNIAIMAKASGDDLARREAQRNINDLENQYARITDAAGLTAKKERMRVAGFRRVKTAEELKKKPKCGIIISAKQLGKKAGKHMAEWNLDVSSEQDRQEFERITRDIIENATEVRRVQWLKDPVSGSRTVEVNAYIKGNDVVLVNDNGEYITTMKDGINNTRVKKGRKE